MKTKLSLCPSKPSIILGLISLYLLFSLSLPPSMLPPFLLPSLLFHGVLKDSGRNYQHLLEGTLLNLSEPVYSSGPTSVLSLAEPHRERGRTSEARAPSAIRKGYRCASHLAVLLLLSSQQVACSPTPPGCAHFTGEIRHFRINQLPNSTSAGRDSPDLSICLSDGSHPLLTPGSFWAFLLSAFSPTLV